MSYQVDTFVELVKKYIEPEMVTVIYDIGAGNCAETVEMSERFPNAKLFAFEANPACIRDCYLNIRNRPRISLIPICVNKYTGTVKFHPINQEKTVTTHKDGNPRASSIFVSNGTYELEQYVQDEITIPCMTIKDMMKAFQLPAPQLVWMDLQGAEVAALKGIDCYSQIDIIHTEAWGKETYTGQGMFDEMKSFVEWQGFKWQEVQLMDDWVWCDMDFVKADLVELKK